MPRTVELVNVDVIVDASTIVDRYKGSDDPENPTAVDPRLFYTVTPRSFGNGDGIAVMQLDSRLIRASVSDVISCRETTASVSGDYEVIFYRFNVGDPPDLRVVTIPQLALTRQTKLVPNMDDPRQIVPYEWTNHSWYSLALRAGETRLAFDFAVFTRGDRIGYYSGYLSIRIEEERRRAMEIMTDDGR